MIRWLAGVIMLALVAGPAHAQPTLRWSPTGSTVRPGDEVMLTISLDEALAVRTFEVFVEYDPALISTVSGGPGAIFSGFGLFQGFEEVNPEDLGRWHGYCVILGATQWATGPGELFHWTVRGDIEGICNVTATEVTLLPPGGGSYPGTTLMPTAITVRDYLSSAPFGALEAAPMTVQPNPFNPRTTICFSLPEAGPVRLSVFDMAGRLVRTLVDTGLPQGANEAVWDGRDASGRAVGSGAYFARLQFAGKVETVRMGLIR